MNEEIPKSRSSRIQSSNRQRIGSISSNSSSSEIYLAHGELYYWPTMVSLLTLGLINVMSSKFYGPIGSILALLNFFVSLEWTNLHSEKLTRKERVFFDESNILRTSENFEFNLGPVLDDSTPGSNQCCGPYPKMTNGLLGNLLRDDREADMQKFYRQHYGQMYQRAKQVELEDKMNATKKQN